MASGEATPMLEVIAEILSEFPSAARFLLVAIVLIVLLGLFLAFPRTIEAFFAVLGVLYFFGILKQ